MECCGDCTVPVELPTGPAGPQGSTGNPGPTGPIGLTGNGISSVTDNGDGTFTFNFTDGSTFTTSDLTGPTGAPGPEGPPASIPTGLICMYTGPLAGAFSTAPADYGTGVGDWVGWALCNPDQTLNNGIYDKQDGTGTIQVPDLEAKFIIGMDPSTAGATLPSSGEPADYSQSTQQNPALTSGEMEHRLQSNESGTNIHTHTASVSGTGKAVGSGTYLGELIESHHQHIVTSCANSVGSDDADVSDCFQRKTTGGWQNNEKLWTGRPNAEIGGGNDTPRDANNQAHFIADGDHEHAVILGGTTVTVDPSAIQHASVDHENRPVYFVVAFVMKL
tara:strand:- start:4785 stop:5783 length:999 start_codon:yes stop_codon:yes gene_type:complete